MEINVTAVIFLVLHWMLWILLILTLTFTAWYVYWKTSRPQRLINQIPGFKDWPLVGDVFHLKPDPTEFLPQVLDLIEEVRPKGIFKLKILESPWLFLFSSKFVEKLTTSKHINKAHEYYPLHPWLGKGLLTSSGDAWRARRHMLTPSFHFSILKDFLGVINEHAIQLTQKLQDEVCDTGESFDIFRLITLSTLDIICCTAMGVNIEALKDDHSEYVKALYIIKEASDGRPMNPLYGPDIIYNNSPAGRKHNRAIKFVHEFAYKIIRERREMKEAGSYQTAGKRRPFLDLLLDCQDEQGNHLTDKEIREEVDTFMFEGHDTTSSAITFAIYLLGTYKDIQRQCQAEVDEILDSCTDMSSTELNKMVYLDWCIKESMRLFPPVPYFARTLEEDESFGDYLVPKGTSVFIELFSLHRDPDAFPDPLRYDPTRFSPQNCLNRNPFAYIPFSAGSRNCIGQKFAMMELKIMIATILKNFNIESVQPRDGLRFRAALVTQPSDDGIQIKLTSRSKSV